MKPVQMREQDDCFRACLASLADMPIDRIPHFFQGLRNGEPIDSDTHDAIRHWFAQLGLCLIRFPLPVDTTDTALSVMKLSHPGPHYILTGRSVAGTDHAVVARDGRIVHDPSPAGVGLFSGHASGVFGICMIGLLL